MLWSAFGVVKHADSLAEKLGEPFGTLILTLSVISIEVIMISAVMLTGAHNPTLGRDMMFSVLMIVLNGLVGLSLLLGGFRHVEQYFNLQGANSFLCVLIPLSVLGLILPNFTESTSTGTFSGEQITFLIIINVALYLAFLGIQTLRHQDYFIGNIESEHKHSFSQHLPIPAHAALLVCYMLPIVFLSKKLAVVVNYGIVELGAPANLGGMIVAIIVLSPEGMAAIRAAQANNLQRSINICLGSALATIGMTVPAVLAIGLMTGETIILGLNNVDSLLLLLTLFISLVNFSSAKSNIIQGLVHLTLFFCYIVLIFD
ncbi:hypothetical protein [Parendozoicomonas sp. Alg238-R29]|uniref:calcium:proton antiporter n=1 Tax=Parendozoicomonas sp. Alg238-R29 TaxID=2993446 RepID=UPI00248E0DFF|nr:hypothetical protein [Parendozoicomonas sp. Alg238-R29]